MKIEVFKTNVQEASQADKILALLLEHFPGNRINFDMHDCDKVLRVEGKDFIPAKIIMLVEEHGFNCTPLQ
ncbi:MAG: hypothetical protein JWN83_2677 [Chitinophagaceae bacterium]|nr:hypothetical protein [Chitinophagaceae bacterium]